MRWLSDGSVKLSKNAPKVLHRLVDNGHFKQEPRKSDKHMPKKFSKKQQAEVAPQNPYGVEVGQYWEDLDPRHRDPHGAPRQVRVIAVGNTHAVLENTQTHSRTTVRLSSFSGRGSKNYKRVSPDLQVVES